MLTFLAAVSMATCTSAACAVLLGSRRRDYLKRQGSRNGLQTLLRLLQRTDLPQWMSRRRASILGKQLERSLPGAVRRARASGLPLDIVEHLARHSEGVLKREMGAILERYQAGSSLERELAALRGKYPDPLLSRFILCLEFARASGGSLARTLTALEEIVRTYTELRGDLRAKTAEARLSAIIVGVLPLVAAVYLGLARPDFALPLVQHPFGRLALAYACLSWLLGVLYLRWSLNTVGECWD